MICEDAPRRLQRQAFRRQSLLHREGAKGKGDSYHTVASIGGVVRIAFIFFQSCYRVKFGREG
jgi:hypothetical protein